MTTIHLNIYLKEQAAGQEFVVGLQQFGARNVPQLMNPVQPEAKKVRLTKTNLKWLEEDPSTGNDVWRSIALSDVASFSIKYRSSGEV